MLRVIKVVHVLAMAVFFGSILGHAVVGLVPGAGSDPDIHRTTREVIAVATETLTIPGLVVLVCSGLLLIAVGRYRVWTARWLALHVGVGLLICLNAAFILLPTGQALLAGARDAALGALSLQTLSGLHQREALFGAANVGLCLAMVVLAVLKPGLGQGPRAGRP